MANLRKSSNVVFNIFVLVVLVICASSVLAFNESEEVDADCVHTDNCKACYEVVDDQKSSRCHFCSPGGVGPYGFCVSTKIECAKPAQGLAFETLGQDHETCQSTPPSDKCEDCVEQENYGFCGFRLVGLPPGAAVPEGDFAGFCIADQVKYVCKTPHPHSLNVIEYTKECTLPTVAPASTPSSASTTSAGLIAAVTASLIYIA